MKTHVVNGLLDVRQAPTVAIVQEETALRTEGVLTEVALSAPGGFAAFDDLVTLTVRTLDGDERHGPFLPKGGYEDEAQCDIHRSPSPLLKHYPPKNLQTGSDKKGAWSVEMPALGNGPWSVSATWTSAKMETRLRIDSVK